MMKLVAKIILLVAMTINLNSMSSEDIESIVDNTILDFNLTKVDKEIIKKAKENPDYYKIKDDFRVEVKEIDNIDLMSDTDLISNFKTKANKLEDTLVVIDRIINIAYKMWEMIVSNKPAANIDTKYAVALPYGISSPSELGGWSRPKSYLISFYFENLYGVDVIRVSYQVTYIYGGNYKGKGKYLAAVWAIPVSVDVMWGFSFNMQAFVPDQTIVNVGTSQNPIAALQLRVSWSASSPLRQINGTSVYYIQGDGYFKEIASPFKKSKIDLSKINEIF